MKKCYNCGVPFSELKKVERTKEHIPARALFAGYPLEYRENRETVPACLKCNEEYASIDDEIRDLIGVTNESDAQKKELAARTVRKIFSNKKELDNRISIENDKISFKFNMSVIDKLHFKNFKGIYTAITKKPLSDCYKLDVYSLGQDENKLNLGAKFIKEIEELDNWNISGHKNVFKYKMVAIEDNSTTLLNFENEIIKLEPKYIMCAMQYNLTVVALVVGLKEDINL